MEKKLENLQQLISKKKDELNLLITSNSSQDQIFMKSVELDIVIAEYLKAVSHYEKENTKLIGKYKDLLEKPFKTEIIEQMKREILEKIEIVSTEELNHFCNNLYVLCLLKIYNVDEQEIIKQLMYRNNLYLHEMKQKGKVLTSDITEIELDFYTKLKNKYLKIIKEKI